MAYGKLKKLNSNGFEHVFVITLVLVGTVIIGTYLIVASHADPIQAEAHPVTEPAAGQSPIIKASATSRIDTSTTTTKTVGSRINSVEEGQLGVSENPLGSNFIPGNPYYSNNQAWCAYFLSWVWQRAGVKDRHGKPFPTYINAEEIKAWGIANHRWHSLGHYTPRVGDAVIFQQGSHVGSVDYSNRGNIEVLAGNYRNKVSFQTSIHGQYLDKPGNFAVKEDNGSVYYIDGFVTPR